MIPSPALLTALHYAMVALWTLAVLLLAPALWRSVVRRKPRYLDSLWIVCLIGVGNRLAMAIADMPPAIADLAAIMLAALFVAVVWSYQRADR